MTVGDVLARAFVEDLIESNNPDAAGLFGAVATTAGPRVNEDTAMRFSAVFRARQILAGVVASLPLKVYEGDDGDRQRVRGTVIDKPHPDQTSFETWELLVDRFVAYGNYYAQKHYDLAGRLRYIEPIHPRDITPKRERKARTQANPFGKVFDVVDADGTTHRVTSTDILHVPSISLDGVRGESVIGLARQGIGLALAAEEYGARLFSQGTLVGGAISTDKVLSPTKAQRLRNRFRQAAAGLRNAHDVLVLDSGASYDRLDLPPEDAQFIESRSFQVAEVARWFGVPRFALADMDGSSNWGTGLEQQQIVTLIYTFGPILMRIGQRLSDELLTGARFAEHDVAGFLRTDFKSQLEAIAKGRQWGVFEGNESRRRLNLPDDPAIGGFLIPQNMTVVGGPEPEPEPEPDPDVDDD
ncbi:MAG: phage portal protein [Actinomycetota bacterium]